LRGNVIFYLGGFKKLGTIFHDLLFLIESLHLGN